MSHSADQEQVMLAAVLPGMDDALAVVDQNGKIVLSNELYARTFGDAFAPRDENDRPLPPESAPLARAARGETFRMSFTLPGTPSRYFEASCAPVRPRPNAPPLAVLTLRDITARKLLEENEARGNALFRNYFELGHMGMAITSCDAHWLMVNNRLCEILGYSQEDLFRTKWTELTHPDDLESDLAQFRRMLAGEIERYELDKRFFHKTGRVVYTSLTVSCQRKADRSVEYVIASVQDITERKLLEREREQFFQFFQLSADPMCIADPFGCFKQVNPALTRLIGYEEAELLAKPFLDFVLPEDRQRTADEMKLQVATRPSLNFENRYVCKDGRVVLLSWTANFDRKEGVTYATARDITERRRLEETVARSNALFRNYFELGQMGMAITQLDQKWMQVNNRLCEILGYAKEELSQKTWAEMTFPDDLEPDLKQFRRLASGEIASYSLDKRFFHKTGRIVHTNIAVSCQRKPDSSVEYFIASIQDITERKRVEDELRNSEQKFRTLAEAVPQIVWITRPDGWNTYFNQQWLDYTGLTPEESHGHGWITPFHPDDKQRAWAAWQHATQTDGVYSLECRLRRADGAYRWWLIRGASQHDEQGQVLNWFGTCTDIQNIKEAEEALLRASAYNRSLIEASLDPLVTIGPDGRITDVNQGTLLATGRAWEEIIGTDFAGYFTDPGKARSGYRQVFQEGRVRDYELELKHKDGRVMPVLYNASVYRDESGQIAGVFAAARDITERKQAEAALAEAARRKDDFLALLGHELRNPLAPIRNAAQILKHAVSAPEQVERARAMIERQALHLTRIVDDLLDVSRISRGKIILHKERADWAELIRLAGEDARSEIESRGLALAVSIPPEPVWVFGDPTRLTQVISNLLANALKFSDSGGRITVDLKTQPRKQSAVLTVADTGIGMSPEILRRIFAPFVQAETDMARSRGGLGLGLALIKGLLELHGGSIQAASAGRGQGSAFTIKLPLAAAEQETKAAPVADGVSRPLRILIIEDNMDAAESLRMLLAFSGHAVEVAWDGPAGIHKARQTHPDVVLCDIGLPGGMNGYEVAQAIRRDEALRGIHLVAMTGYGQDEDKRRAREAGFDEHVTKPVDPAALERLLSAAPGVEK
jgi:PAS domain S-box-containing protein